MYIGPGAEETWKFDQNPDNPKGKTSCGSIPSILQGCRIIPNGGLKRDGKHLHFGAGSVSQKVIMDLISSANDIGMHQGICYYLGKMNKNSASIVLTPRVSETASLSRASAAEGHL